ncbi:MAG: hypothetical protein M0Z71_04685, partial [Nitrospiraceae bacterium]|nr:hypothetical protein [Nitrospiraceae bacterium]
MADQKIQLIIEAFDKTKEAFKTLENSIKGTGEGVKGLGATCKETHAKVLDLGRALQVLVAGAGIKQLVDTFMSYNKTLETSKLGIAAIITSMAQVTDAQGRSLEGAEKFAASQAVAATAQRELQNIAMRTSATYQELVEVYQGILAPALSAKMTFKETLEITGLLTNAVKAIGLPFNQIKQEARDLIQGGIQPASSSLAIALGITDSMVKQWREAGTIFQELNKRLEGFKYASNEFANTWEGAWSNLKDVTSRALGEGFKPVFEKLKKELISLTNSFVNIIEEVDKKTGQSRIVDIQIKPEIKEKLEEISRAILNVIEGIKTLFNWGKKMWDAIGKEALYVALTAWIGKVALAFVELAGKIGIATAAARAFKATAIGFLIEAGVWVGKKIYDDTQANEMAERIRKSIAANPKNYVPGLEHLSGGHIQSILEKAPDLDEKGIQRAIEQGAIKIKPPMKETTFDGAEIFANASVEVDKKAIAKMYEEAEKKFNIKGKKKPQDDEQKKKLLEEKKEELKLKLESLK